METTSFLHPTRPLALGYVRVSTVDQVENGASLDAQVTALTFEAERRGWDLEIIREEGKSAKNLNRPALQAALARLDRGQANYLLAIRLDRVSRSVVDFAGLLVRSRKKGCGIVFQSPNIDTTDPAGEFTINVLASAAQYERQLISARTKAGMDERKKSGWEPTPKNPTGRPAGRPRKLPQSVLARIAAERATGLSLDKIAAKLEADGIPTAHGGLKWRSSTLSGILKSLE